MPGLPDVETVSAKYLNKLDDCPDTPLVPDDPLDPEVPLNRKAFSKALQRSLEDALKQL